MNIDLNDLLISIIKTNEDKIANVIVEKIGNKFKGEYEHKITEALENVISNKLRDLTDYFIQSIHKITLDKMTDITEEKIIDFLKTNKKVKSKINEFLDKEFDKIDVLALLNKFFEVKKDELSHIFFDRMLASMQLDKNVKPKE
jgi:hypothetical protein